MQITPPALATCIVILDTAEYVEGELVARVESDILPPPLVQVIPHLSTVQHRPTTDNACEAARVLAVLAMAQFCSSHTTLPTARLDNHDSADQKESSRIIIAQSLQHTSAQGKITTQLITLQSGHLLIHSIIQLQKMWRRALPPSCARVRDLALSQHGVRSIGGPGWKPRLVAQSFPAGYSGSVGLLRDVVPGE